MYYMYERTILNAKSNEALPRTCRVSLATEIFGDKDDVSSTISLACVVVDYEKGIRLHTRRV